MVGNFAEFIFKLNQQRPDKVALVDELQSLTYAELECHARQFASDLLDAGIKPQQRVIISMDDCVDWPVAFLALLAVGANPVCVNPNNTLANMNKIRTLVDAVAIISATPLELDADIKQIRKSDILTSRNAPIATFYQYHPDEFCFWLMTSGTTGNSKSMVHRHSNLERYWESTSEVYKVHSDSRLFTTAKMSFTYGLNMGITLGLAQGATVYLMSGIPSPTRIFDLFDQHDITLFFSNPTVINSMMKHGKNRTINPSVQRIVSASEPLSVSISERFQTQFSMPIYNTFGMSETLAMCTMQTLDNYEHGTFGTPMPGIAIEIRDENGYPVPDGEVGDMYVNTDCAAFMYWKDWEYTKQTYVGKWIKTGDKIRKTERGNYVYVSRANDQVKINAMFVSAVEIESAILSLDLVDDCAVAFDTVSSVLPEIHAFLITDKPLADSEIRKQLADKLPAFKIPKHYHTVDSFPRTLTNKKIRHQLIDGLQK